MQLTCMKFAGSSPTPISQCHAKRGAEVVSILRSALQNIW